MRLLLALAVVAAPIGAQEPIGHPSKVKGGRKLVLAVPFARNNLSGGNDSLTVTATGPGWAVNGVPTEVLLGFPPRDACVVQWGTTRKDKKRAQLLTQLYCKASGRLIDVRLPIDDSAAARAFRAIVTDSSEIGKVYQVLEDRLSSSVFTGALASVPEPNRRPLLRIARALDASPFFAAESFQSRTFFGVNIGHYPSLFNSAKLTQNQRIATAFRGLLLNYIKSFNRALGDASGVDGVSLTVTIVSENFVTRSGATVEVLRIYLPSALINRFADAEITDQELVDGAVVMLNGNRSKVVVADGG